MKQSSRKRILVAVLLTVTGLAGVRAACAHSAITRPVSRFIHFYQVTENPAAPMSVWERVLFSLVLANRDCPKSKV